MSSPTAIRTTPTAAVKHPDWCALEHCDMTAGFADIRHSAAPDVWTTGGGDDIEVQLAVQRDDEIVQGEQGVRKHGLALRLQHLTINNLDGSTMCMEVLLTEDDIARFEQAFAAYRDLTARR